MFAPVVLPLQITAIVFAAALLLTCMVARRGKPIALAFVAAFFLFIPSCTGVMYVVDQFRYGRFEYATALDVPDDGYIELPPAATEIVLHRNGGGHHARFQVPTIALKSWVAQMRSLRPDLNPDADAEDWLTTAPDTVRAEMAALQSQQFNHLFHRFHDMGWQYDPRMIEQHVSRSSRGGGYTIWHVAETGETYLAAGYW